MEYTITIIAADEAVYVHGGAEGKLESYHYETNDGLAMAIREAAEAIIRDLRAAGATADAEVTA